MPEKELKFSEAEIDEKHQEALEMDKQAEEMVEKGEAKTPQQAIEKIEDVESVRPNKEITGEWLIEDERDIIEEIEKELTPEIKEAIMEKVRDINKPGTMIRYSDLDKFKEMLGGEFYNSACKKIGQEEDNHQEYAVWREVYRTGIDVGLNEYLSDIEFFYSLKKDKNWGELQEYLKKLYTRWRIAGPSVSKQENEFISHFLLGTEEIQKRKEELQQIDREDLEKLRTKLAEWSEDGKLSKGDDELLSELNTPQDVQEHKESLLKMISQVKNKISPSREYEYPGEVEKIQMLIEAICEEHSYLIKKDECKELIDKKINNEAVFDNEEVLKFANFIFRTHGKAANLGEQIPDIGYILKSDKDYYKKQETWGFTREYLVTGSAKNLIEGVVVMLGYQGTGRAGRISEELKIKLQKATFGKALKDMVDYFKDDLEQCVPIYDAFGNVIWPQEIRYENIINKDMPAEKQR